MWVKFWLGCRLYVESVHCSLDITDLQNKLKHSLFIWVRLDNRSLLSCCSEMAVSTVLIKGGNYFRTNYVYGCFNGWLFALSKFAGICTALPLLNVWVNNVFEFVEIMKDIYKNPPSQIMSLSWVCALNIGISFVACSYVFLSYSVSLSLMDNQNWALNSKWGLTKNLYS